MGYRDIWQFEYSDAKMDDFGGSPANRRKGGNRLDGLAREEI